MIDLIDEKKLPPLPETPGISGPARAWALAKAAYEIAHERNFAEQHAATAAATADDPEPPFHNLPADFTREQRQNSMDTWFDWNDRNHERIYAATKPIIARYPNNLKKLLKLAEANLVDWAEEQMREKFSDRFATVAGAFAAYREGLLFGEMREKFITICFNTPES